MYWDDSGTPITAGEFMKQMFADLPQFFEDADQLRDIWGNPNTREKLLEDLSAAGYNEKKLEGMKDLIDAKPSNVYDVLAYVAYATKTRTRKERVIEFTLDNYIEDGVKALSPSKIQSLVTLKYNTISDAATVLGSPKAIWKTFVGFQKYLYQASRSA